MAAPMRRKARPVFDLQDFLARRGHGRLGVDYRRNQIIFAQGDPADAVFYIETGGVKLAVDSHTGKEAVIGMLEPGDFFGEDCLSGQPVRHTTASALSECSLLRLPKPLVTRFLQAEPEFRELFLSHLISRNIRIEEDLVDQLFNSSEKRLARMLLLLANFGKEDNPEGVIPKVSQETLAEMVGTTRSRVSFFMNQFRKRGFIEYDGEIRVHSSLLSVVLQD